MVRAVLRAYMKEIGGVQSKKIQLSEIVRDYPVSDAKVLDVHITYEVYTGLDEYEEDSQNQIEPWLQDIRSWKPSLEEVDTCNAEPFDVNVSEAASESEAEGLNALDPNVRRQYMQEIEKVHRGLGHPCQSRFLRILKMGGASTIIQKLAQQFECSQCKESARPKPWRRAAPPRELTFNQVVGVDTVTLKHFEQKVKCLNMICWGTRYQLIIPLKGTTAQDIRNAYRTWVKLFGPPQIVKPDLGREFQAEFAYRCTTDGSEVDPASLESPTQNAITEREGKSYKMMFAKASLEYGETTDEEIIRELIDIVTMMKNRLTHRSGYSAVHRALGYTPTMPGNLMSEDQDNVAHASALQIGDVCLQRQARMREAAGRAFFSAECADAIARAITSGHRRIEKFEIGQKIFFWSVGVHGKVAHPNSASRKPNHMFWHGPARVVAVQNPHTVYVTYQGRLFKTSPEQCRFCSSDEDASSSDMIQQLCQARDELASSQEAGVHDIRGQPRPETSPENHPTGKKRALVKQPPTNSRKRPAAASQRGIKRAASQEGNQEDINKARREDPIDDMSYTPTSEESDHPTVEMNSDIEGDDELVLEVVNGLNLEIVDAETWLNATSNTREIQLKNLGPKDMQLFDEAIKKEWNTNVEAGAVAVIPPIEAQKIRQQQPHRIMQSRLLHVAKPIDDLSQFDQEKILSCSPSGEPCKAKSRWIARGDKDPDVFTVPSSSPVIHRDTFTMGLQVISSNKWRIHFADFSQAFMQGDSLTREEPLFCEPPDSKLLGLAQGSLIEIRKTVYGLVDAPFRWNQHLDRELQNLGYRPSLLFDRNTQNSVWIGRCTL